MRKGEGYAPLLTLFKDHLIFFSCLIIPYFIRQYLLLNNFFNDVGLLILRFVVGANQDLG